MRKSFYRNYGIVKNRRDFQQAVVGTDSVTCFSSRLCNGLNDSPQAIQTQSQKEKKNYTLQTVHELYSNTFEKDV